MINSTLKKELFLEAFGLPKDAIKWEKIKKRNDRRGTSMCDVCSILHSILTRGGGPCVDRVPPEEAVPRGLVSGNDHRRDEFRGAGEG